MNLLRRRPFLFASLFFLFSLAMAAAVFLFTFDLNRYREEIQAELTAVAGRPITLGAARLSLRHGLALNFSELSVPATTEATWSLEAPALLAKVKLAALLRGRVELSGLLLHAPRLTIVLRPNPSPAPLTLPQWHNIGIRTLTIQDGSITVDDRRNDHPPTPLRIDKLRLRLRNFSSGRRASVTLEGKIEQPHGGTGRVHLAGEVVPAEDFRQSALKLALKVENLDATSLTPHLSAVEKLSGALDLSLDLSGSIASGLQVAGEIGGREMTAILPDWYREPLRIRTLRLSGKWMQEAGVSQLTDFQLGVDNLAVRGNLLWKGEGEDLWLNGMLTTPVQPVIALAPVLPDHGPLAAVKKRLIGGTWQVENLQYRGLAKDLTSAGEGLQGKLTVWDLPLGASDARLGSTSFVALLSDDRLHFDGTIGLLQTPVRFTGEIAHPFTAQRQFAADFNGAFTAGRLLTELPPSVQQNIAVEGRLPFKARMEGNQEKLLLTLDSRLEEAVVGFSDTLDRPQPFAANLALTANIHPDTFEIETARLQTPLVDLRGQGKIALKKRGSFDLSFAFAGLDLEKLRPHLSILDRFEARGQVDGNCRLASNNGQIDRRTGTFLLRDVALYPTMAIAPLSNINGRLDLKETRLVTEQITARLGRSPVVVTGYLGWDPLLANLHVRGKSIRADELIFSSGQWLRDVDGRLRIDRHGIEFAPATVHLDGGTTASVRGKVDFTTVAVNLDIEAKRGNIDEVIALWQKPPEGKEGTSARTSAREKEQSKGVQVRIAARVEEGNLGELQFRQAAGEISYQHGLLEIFPLRFQVGSGHCTGRVAVEFSEGAPLLKTSGHLEQVDAAEIYQQLLKRRGLITGTLHGDFYLEGRLGEFLQTSIGGFNMETRDGMLRKFSVLGKIFSLLNVSQIAALQWPDMARDGMPFQRLAGHFSMRKGVLATEDLFLKSPAMNMSIVGTLDLPAKKLDFIVGIKPLRTVDKIVTSIPIAGWVLAGEEKALITIHFHVHGDPDAAEVNAIPITSVSEKIFGIFRRVLQLPAKMIDDIDAWTR